MFKKFLHAVDKKLGKFGFALGLAGISATTVACYGPPQRISDAGDHDQAMIQKYSEMCGGRSCAEYCKTNSCSESIPLKMAPCDPAVYKNSTRGGRSLYFCDDEKYRVVEWFCAGTPVMCNNQLVCPESIKDGCPDKESAENIGQPSSAENSAPEQDAKIPEQESPAPSEGNS